MNKTIEKTIITIASIIGITLISYIGYTIFVVYTFTSGCGLDDGPFKAVKINPIELTESSEKFKLLGNALLVLTNREGELSPVFTLIEDGKTKWTLDMDVSKTEGYESYRLWKINNVNLTQNINQIKLTFTAHWTYGAENGSMKINRKNGKNTFCLSW